MRAATRWAAMTMLLGAAASARGLDLPPSCDVATSLVHEQMAIRIGTPAVIAPGGAYPDVVLHVRHPGSVEGDVVRLDNGEVVRTIPATPVQPGGPQTLALPGEVPGEGRYRIRLRGRTRDEGAGPGEFHDALYFTVLDAGRLAEPHAVAAHPGPDGRLRYTPDYRGNRIPDFSHAGYRNGNEPIPDVPVRATVEPAGGDDTQRIQDAIDRVSRRTPDDDGFRGAVLLKAGIYDLAGTVRIRRSGVVLRGEGAGNIRERWFDAAENPTLDAFKRSLADRAAHTTILIATGDERRSLIMLAGERGVTVEADTRSEILDRYVPVGARRFRVAHPGRFAAGDTIVVRRTADAEWVRTLGMDQIPDRGNRPSTLWEPRTFDSHHVIVAVDGNEITIASSIVDAIDRRWGGGHIVRSSDAGLIRDSGVESIRGISFGVPGSDPKRIAVNTLVQTYHARDAWVRDVVAEHFHGNGVLALGTLGLTVQRCSLLLQVMGQTELYPGWVHAYTVRIQGASQHVLVRDSYALNNRHAFSVCAWVTGPNVFLDCFAEPLGASEPHHRWSTGGLYDNVRDGITLMNRLSFGTGHGWSGANYVAWNTRGRLICQKPPTAQNWAIGHVGERRPGPFHRWNEATFGEGETDAFWESHGTHVEPRSLYLQQLADRRQPPGT